MKLSRKNIQGKIILANDHYTAIPYDCSSLSSLATDGVIKEGTLIPSNDGNALGVLLNDVILANNPNGTLVIHGFIKQSALPAAPSQEAVNALIGKGVQFIDADGKPQIQKYAVSYDKNGGTGTVTDSNSPYAYGDEVTVLDDTGLTPPATKSFSKWNTKADATGTDYDPADTFAITGDVTLYAIWA